MEWNVLIIGGTTLIVFVSLLIKPILSFYKSINDLNWSIKTLNNTFSELKDDNKGEHKYFRTKIDEHDDKINIIEINCMMRGASGGDK